jgi:hypothetical protein
MRPNSLQAVLDGQKVTAPAESPTPPSPPPATEPPQPAKTYERPSRQNKRLIGGHFDPAVARRLRRLAAEEDTTVQALLEEALDLLFVKKGKGKIIGG